MLYAGIDAGSRAIKAIILDGDTQMPIATGIVDQGVRQESLARDLFKSLLAKTGHGEDAVALTVATGYGRNLVTIADTTVTEITCHARGITRNHPGAMTIVEIGGQDSKIIRLDSHGAVRDFAMNDRCAAGTGRFLEIVANRLEIDLNALGALAARSVKPAAISSMCAVFAETEIVGLLASGVPPEDIIAGVQLSIARRVASMAGRNVEGPVVFTGGVALVSGMAAALQDTLERQVNVATDPQFSGALGAALIAAERG